MRGSREHEYDAEIEAREQAAREAADRVETCKHGWRPPIPTCPRCVVEYAEDDRAAGYAECQADVRDLLELALFFAGPGTPGLGFAKWRRDVRATLDTHVGAAERAKKPKLAPNLPKTQKLTEEDFSRIDRESSELVAAVEAHTASLDGLVDNVRIGAAERAKGKNG